jgi:hypothetical protein
MALVLYGAVPALIAGLMAYYLRVSLHMAGEIGFPLDDSWIHVRFAQNLARGHGFSFNPGQPAGTTTAPLWTLVLALGYRLTGEYLFTSAAVNWLFCTLTAITAAALARTLVPNRGFTAAAALVVAATVPLPWFALSGMEPALFMWLTLLAVLLHARLRRARGAAGLAPTAVCALAALTRPECLLLFPLTMLDRLLMARHDDRGAPAFLPWLRQAAAHTTVFVIMVAPLFIYNDRVIGRPLPSSYYIKAMNYGVVWGLAMQNDALLMHSLLLAPLKELGSLLVMWAANNPALILPFLFGAYWLTREATSPDTAQRSLLIPLLLIAQPVAWAVATNFHRPPSFQSQRYFANLGPLYLIVGMAGAWWYTGRLSPWLRRGALPIGLGVVLIASLARQPSRARLYGCNVRDITRMQVTTARWVRDRVPAEAYLAVNDVGAVAVITQSRVLDLMGLVSPEILACLTLDRARASTWRDCTRQVLAQAEPDYLVTVTHREQHQAMLRSSTATKPIFHLYNEDNITSGGPMVVIYETVWCRYPPMPPASLELSGQVLPPREGMPPDETRQASP